MPIVMPGCLATADVGSGPTPIRIIGSLPEISLFPALVKAWLQQSILIGLPLQPCRVCRDLRDSISIFTRGLYMVSSVTLNSPSQTQTLQISLPHLPYSTRDNIL